jgi:hypothetical protein
MYGTDLYPTGCLIKLFSNRANLSTVAKYQCLRGIVEHFALSIQEELMSEPLRRGFARAPEKEKRESKE